MGKNKIKQYSLFKAKALLQQPIADATHRLTEISFLVLRIRLYSGVIGESYLLSFQYSPGAITGALRDVGEMLLGEEVQDTVHCFQRVDAANETLFLMIAIRHRSFASLSEASGRPTNVVRT
jgi:hypothetical protein